MMALLKRFYNWLKSKIGKQEIEVISEQQKALENFLTKCKQANRGHIDHWLCKCNQCNFKVSATLTPHHNPDADLARVYKAAAEEYEERGLAQERFIEELLENNKRIKRPKNGQGSRVIHFNKKPTMGR